MKNEPMAISLLLFTALFLEGGYGWLTSLVIATVLTLVILYSPIIKLGDMLWSLSRNYTIMIGDGSNSAFLQHVILEEEGMTTLWATLGPLFYVPSLIVLRHLHDWLSIHYIAQVLYAAAILSITLVIESSADSHGTSLRLLRATVLMGILTYLSLRIIGDIEDPVSVTLLSSYLSVLLSMDVRNVTYLASNGATNVVIGGHGMRDALVIMPVTVSSFVWLLFYIFPI